MTKGRIRIVRIALCAALIAAVVTTVNAGKNPLVRKIMTVSLQNIFQAKADIGYVNLKIFDSSLTIREIAVADKEKPMENLFEIENVVLDFDMRQLLKGKFVTEKGEMTGITYGTPRKTSGALPENEKYILERAVKKKFEVKKDAVLKALSEKAQADVASILGTYNPETFMEETLDSLKTPEMKDEILNRMETIVENWENRIDETKKEIELFEERIEKLSETDMDDGLTPAKIVELIKDVKNMVDSVKALRDQAEEIQLQFTGDTESIQKLAHDFSSSVQHDSDLVRNKIKEIKIPDIKDGEKFISGYLDTVCVELLGKWYPVFLDGIEAAREFQQSGKTIKLPEKKKEPKKLVVRAEGRNVAYSRDLPSFLIRELTLGGNSPDGKFAVEGTIRNISNNADLLDMPVTGKMALARDSYRENISFTGDFRSRPEKNMLDISFDGGSYPVKMEADDVISMEGAGKARAGITCGTGGRTEARGAVSLSQVMLVPEKFEPDFIFDLYSDVLAEIKSAEIGITFAFDPEKDLDIDLETDLDRQISDGLRKVMTAEINTMKEKLRSRVDERLAEIREEFNGEMDKYNLMKSRISENIRAIRNLEERLKERQKDLEQKSLRRFILKN